MAVGEPLPGNGLHHVHRLLINVPGRLLECHAQDPFEHAAQRTLFLRTQDVLPRAGDEPFNEGTCRREGDAHQQRLGHPTEKRWVIMPASLPAWLPI
jgi:hypothetical protein